MKRIGDGAEAIVYQEKDRVVKDRPKKGYRIAEIDERLRRSRTKKEAKILAKLSQLGIAPKLLKSDEQNMRLEMEFIDGSKVRDILTSRNSKRLGAEIGKKVAELHNHNIIHSDLTTSNMILKDGKIYLIDFGLSFESAKLEDKAVDLHLLRQALESKHHKIWQKAFAEILKSYASSAKQGPETILRMEIVESRGRNKSKGS